MEQHLVHRQQTQLVGPVRLQIEARLSQPLQRQVYGHGWHHLLSWALKVSNDESTSAIIGLFVLYVLIGVFVMFARTGSPQLPNTGFWGDVWDHHRSFNVPLPHSFSSPDSPAR